MTNLKVRPTNAQWHGTPIAFLSLMPSYRWQEKIVDQNKKD